MRELEATDCECERFVRRGGDGVDGLDVGADPAALGGYGGC